MKKRILTVLLAVCLVFALGTVTALADENVAEVNGTGYPTLEAAFNNATNGGTITLLKDASLTSKVTISKDITLNGNNHKITGVANNADVNFLVTSGTFKISNVTLTGFGSSAGTDSGIAVIKVNSGATGTNVIANNVNIKDYCRSAYDIRAGRFEITGGTINSGTDASGSNSKLTKGIMVGYGSSTATGTITGVTITNSASNYDDWNTAGIEVYKNGSVDISNCNISNVDNGIHVDNYYDVTSASVTGPDVEISNVTVQATNDAIRVYGGSAGAQSAKVVVTGGSYTGDIAVIGGTSKEAITLTNATVNGSIDNAGGSMTFIGGVVKTDDGTTPANVTFAGTSVNGTSTTTAGVVAQVGSNVYTDLQSAINAANNGDTVKLIDNVSIAMTNVQPNNGAITINKDITLDGNGKTITATGTKPSGSTHVILVTANGATVENLTIDVDGKATSGIQAYKADNVSIDDVKIMDAYGAAVIVNTSTVTASDLTTTGSGWGGVNVDNGDNTTGNAKFTLTSGNVESIYTDNSSTTQTATIIVNGGTVGTVKNDSAAGAGKNSITINNGYVGRLDNDSTKSGATIVVNGGNFGESVDEYVASSLKYEAIKASGSYKYTYHSNATDALQAAGQNGTVNYVAGNGWDVTLYYDKDVQTKIEVPDDYVLTLPGGTFEGKQIEGWKYGSEVFEPGDKDTITSNRTYYVILRNGQYNIVIDDDIKHGDVSTDVSSADKGATVYIYVDPDIGYVLDDLNVYYGANNRYSVTVSYVRAGVYKFTMPNASVYITATFKYAALPFTDVNRNQWFYDEVFYVYTNGMMEGDSATTFNPDGRMTRAMFWAVLGRIDGATITGNDWAEEARAWAMREGVSDGTNPNDYVTREQMVTMLWRYAGEKNGSASLIRYTDADKISSYAVEAMRWAIGNGIIEGMTSTTLEPQGTATRAQCAAIFMRFDQM